MKRILIVSILLLLSINAIAQKKKTSGKSTKAKPSVASIDTTPKKAKSSVISQQMSALIKAVADSINGKNPKDNSPKIVYGTLSLITFVIPVYNPDNSQLLNVGFNQDSKASDSVKYVYLTVDTVQVSLVKNSIDWIHVHVLAPTLSTSTLENDSTIVFPLFKESDTFHLKIGKKIGVIKLSDFLSYLRNNTINDNIKSGTITFSKGVSKVLITSY